MATTKEKIAGTAALAAGVGLTLLFSGAPKEGDFRYADDVLRLTAKDIRVAAHRQPVFEMQVVGKDTVRVAVDSIDVPEAVDRERIEQRPEAALKVGDTVRTLVTVNGVIYSEGVRAITEEPAAGCELAIYNRLLIWDKGLKKEEKPEEEPGEIGIIGETR
jgi:hypothetical protein